MMGTEDYTGIKGRRPRQKSGLKVRTTSPGPRKSKAQVRRFNKTKDAVILADEVSKEFDEVLGLRFGHLPMFRSKVSNPKSRQHRPLDREILKQMGKIVKNGGLISLAVQDRRVVLKLGLDKSRAQLRKKPRPAAKTTRKSISQYLAPLARMSTTKVTKGGSLVHQIGVPAWDHASIVLKTLAYGAAIPSWHCWAYSLQISEETIRAALKSKKGLAAFMQDRIVRAMKPRFQSWAGFVPDFLLIMEGYISLEDFHAHGVFDSSWQGRRSRPPLAKMIGPIQDALREAGGEVTSKARQLTVKPITNLPGWFDYCTKRMLTTAHQIKQARAELGMPALEHDESLLGVTMNLRRRGKAWYRDARLSNEPVLKLMGRKP